MATVLEERKAVEQTMAESIVAEPELPFIGGFVADEPRTTLDPRVLKGCEFLDREHPGWATAINLDVFRLDDGTRCVLGQVYGDYNDAANTLLRRLPHFVSHLEYTYGFCGRNGNNEDWDRLEADWRLAIAARQNGG